MPTFPGLGRRVAEVRASRFWTQQQLAEAARMNVRTVQRAESLDTLQLSSLHTIAAALGVGIDELVRATRSGTPDPDADRPSTLRDYILALQARSAQLRQPLVFPSLAGSPIIESIADLVRLIETHNVVQVVGEGGMGKSLLLAHAVDGLARRGCLPIYVSARNYDGDLARTLDEAVAPFSSASASEILGAREEPMLVVVLVDGTNECREDVLPGLCEELAALRNRQHAALVVSSREASRAFDGCVLSIPPYTRAQRTEILRIHTPAGSPRIDETFFAILDKPLDLRLAARCHAELPEEPTPHEIRLAFARQTLRERVRGPAVAFECLIQIASTMTATVRQVLPLSEVVQIVGQIAESAASGFTTADEILDAGLLEHHQGRCAFSHEIFLKLFHTHALLRQAEDESRLCSLLRSPRNARCRAMAVQAAREEDRLDLIARLEDSEIVALALNGGLGAAVERRIGRALSMAVVRAESAAAEVRVEVGSGPIFFARSTDAQCWSWLERELFQQVGSASLVDLEMQALARRVIASTDRALVRLADQIQTRPYSSRDVAYRSVYLLRSSARLPAADILQGASLWTRTARAEAIEFARHPHDLGWGELLYALEIWRRLSDPEKLEDPTGLLLGLLDACWAKRIGNLRMEALEVAPTHAYRLNASHVAAVVAWVDAREDHGDPMLGTSILHALGTLGAFEEIEMGDEVTDSLGLALASPRAAEGREAAYQVISGMLDHPVLSQKYCEAVEGLSESEARTLYAAAVLGAPEDGLFLSFAMQQLAKRADLADDVLAKEALLEYARPPVPTSILPDEPVNLYARCLQGLAAAGLPPPRPTGPLDELDKLWFAYGEIIHGVARARLAAPADLQAAWRCVLDMPAEIAVAPLAWLDRARPFDERRLTSLIIGHCACEVRQVVERSLLVLGELVDLFAVRIFGPKWQEHDLGRLQTFVVNLAGQVGDGATRELLSRWVDSSQLGAAVLRAIGRIDERL